MLFIDANAYLEFYNSSQSSIKKLLPSLNEIKDEIFLTKQIFFEVRRNRLNIVSTNLISYLNSCKLNGIHLPEHLENEPNEEINKWNKSFSQCVEQIKKENKSLQIIVEKIISEVQSGKDQVSLVLKNIFSKAESPTDKEIDRARYRKEIGNPPGKKADPLGDQISWEQLLSNYSGVSPLWIISYDDDYSSKIEKKRYLNAFLYEELCEKAGGDVVVHVFDSIAEGIKHYSDNRLEPVKVLPSEEDLRQISCEEALQNVSYVHSKMFLDLITCFKCGKSEGFNGPIPKPSEFGGWTYQWICKACGKWLDLGEPYDD